jgi:hypothetical protein
MTIKKLILTNILISLSLLPFQALAFCDAPIVPCGRFGTPRCNLCHIFELLSNALEFVITCLVPVVAVIMLVAGGTMFMLSRMEAVSVDIFTQAKGAVTAVVIGLIILFGAWVFLNTFLSTIGLAEWTGLGNWWEIQCITPP